ncbi:MAG TPA: ligase-associated DNA damage response endonuclease PdeM [Gemmatimonadaceae bacterium]|jgi:DNA ligase-associated metallophosphoesterase
MSITITLAGEDVLLMPDRSLYWPAAATLFVADAHVGKAATFRASGIFVPRGTTSATLARLDGSLECTGAKRLIFLGDLLHAREGRAAETLRVVGEWRTSHRSLDVVLVRGNHDRSAGDPPQSLGIRCVDAPLREGPFAFVHHPTAMEARYVIAGHVHPAVRLSGPGRQHLRLPCFWVTAAGIVLPAFGDFTGLGIIEPAEDDRVFAVADESVVEVSVEKVE